MANYDDWKADDTTWEDRQAREQDGPVVVDFVATWDGGSLALVEPRHNAAAKWLADHVGPESQWWGRSLVVEPRYLEPLLARLEEDGFRTEL